MKHAELPEDFRAPHFGEARRLANGNTLVCNYWKKPTAKGVQVFEITPEKKIVWLLRDPEAGSLISAKPILE